MMQLSRQISAITKTFTASKCFKDFVTMDQAYRNVRARSREPMDGCHWCKHRFQDGEKFALAICETGGNKVLCNGCADELLMSDICF